MSTPDLRHFEHLPQDIIYANDKDFFGLDHVKTKEIQKILGNYQSRVNFNTDNLQNYLENENTWNNFFLIGYCEDIERRKQLSTEATVKLSTVWSWQG